jgi:hypothetical protein
VPLDPIVSLSVALAEAPGSCACLLGAGVSVDAGVPTAWGIYEDGLRRLYELQAGNVDSLTEQQLNEWLKANGHENLDYSSLLDLIAPDAAIRREWIASYFKDTEPGSTHELLAEIAALGIIKVFITTNFDRLLERALLARGIEPVVVSDDGTLAAAPKREHASVFIVKAHGDYLQETIRNTPSELSELDPNLTDELRRIVSRYGVWWLSVTNPPAEVTQGVIEAVGARVIVRPGAGEFLSDLNRRLSIHAQHETGDDPGTVHDEVLALVKRDDPVALDEMLRRERFAFESAIESVAVEYTNRGDVESVKEGWGKLSAATDRRLASLIPLALHRSEALADEIRAMTSWASSVRPRNGLVVWVQGWQLPFWVIGMTVGALAVRFERCGALSGIFSAGWTDPNGYRTRFVGPPGDLGKVVAANFGPKAQNGQWLFPEWQWLITDLPTKEWLASRYPDWLSRDGEPARSFVEFSLLLDIASGLRGEDHRVAWWSIDSVTATRFAQRLHRDPVLRARIAEAVGRDLATFDQRAPEVLTGSHGMGTFPDTGNVVSALKGDSLW